MKRRTKQFAILGSAINLLVATTTIAVAGPSSANPHPRQSVKVAIVGSPNVINGGSFPTTTAGPTGAFTDFTFTTIPVGNVSAATLVTFDTVLLNVASAGMACTTNSLSASQKADLVSFVAGGKKLIIYDSECPSNDYNWLPFRFTTNNPGAQGAQGALNIVENSTLSSKSPADPHYIDEVALETSVDAVGDANVFTTFDPHWCVAIAATNVQRVTGPVRTYARLGAPGSVGLMIYNGLDVDFMGSTTAPDSVSGGGNLAKLWLQELQQPINPDELPCGFAAVGLICTAPPPPPPGAIFAKPGIPTLGTAGDDVIYGTSGSDKIAGLGGNDTIFGLGGDDNLSGGDGDDTLCGGEGNDQLAGEGGNDTLSGDAGNDALSGGFGNDVLFGGAGNDELSGGAGDDRLLGGLGVDRLNGEQGADTCTPGGQQGDVALPPPSCETIS